MAQTASAWREADRNLRLLWSSARSHRYVFNAGTNIAAERPGEAALITIHLTQSDIADLVRVSRERVNQVIIFFRAQKMITVRVDGKIVVLNGVGLAGYCR